jgi:hypothetical protein
MIAERRCKLKELSLRRNSGNSAHAPLSVCGCRRVVTKNNPKPQIQPTSPKTRPIPWHCGQITAETLPARVQSAVSAAADAAATADPPAAGTASISSFVDICRSRLVRDREMDMGSAKFWQARNATIM